MWMVCLFGVGGWRGVKKYTVNITEREAGQILWHTLSCYDSQKP